MVGYKVEYERWRKNATADADIQAELRVMTDSQIEDAFYRDLAFGTGGLRGKIGAGTNRMNVYTVARASQGLANYLGSDASVVIGYDSRIKSELFAKIAAGVFASNGLKVYLWSELIPVPAVSFAIRYLNASQGVMITASHNPAEYNGYKVYGADGCQITLEAANAILKEINKVDPFDPVICSAPNVETIDSVVLNTYLGEVIKQSVLFGDTIDRDVSIIYSPLNGTGLKPVTRVLEEARFTNITVVKEQEKPDGLFPTCPYPNPEIRDAMELGIRYCQNYNADLLLATDPDCDRCGIAVKDGDGYRLFTGNEVGLLLFDYICSQRLTHCKMPVDPVFIKTIVTMDIAERIATHYGVRTINVLTGFKLIGEQIDYLEQDGREGSYIFGFEESYGYLTGTYVRDKDAVDAAFMICEMFAFYKTRGVSLLDKLDELWSIYGYCLNTLHSFDFPGMTGMTQMQIIMTRFHDGINEIGGLKVIETQDYSKGLNGLPKSDVLKYILEDNCSVVIRPSGTEPKLKVYISVSAENERVAREVEGRLVEDLRKHI